MLKHWDGLLNTDCTVMSIRNHVLYPIFRVGYTSLSEVCEKKYTNDEIKACEDIKVMIRDPEQRFVSGVNEYCRQNKITIQQAWPRIEKGQLMDRHFAPQYMWLLHLYKYYKGHVIILPFDYISKITSVHKRKGEQHEQVPLIQSFVEVDRALMQHYNEKIELGVLIERYRDVLS
jgi:hypothetical protein